MITWLLLWLLACIPMAIGPALLTVSSERDARHYDDDSSATAEESERG